MAERRAKLGNGLHTCPMCPDVSSPTAGDCPSCGMALEPARIEGRAALAAATESQLNELREVRRRMLVGGALAVPLLALWLIVVAGNAARADGLPAALVTGLAAAQLALSLPVVGYAAVPLLKRGANSVRARSPNMFTLLALAITVVWLYSVAVVIWSLAANGGELVTHTYFEAAAAITAFAMLGQYLEHRSRRTTVAAIHGLLDLAPPTASLLEEGSVRTVASESLKPGDVVLVTAGERIPADGVVLEGDSWVDEAMLTGEPTPRRKASGATVTGGTINGNGGLRVKLTKTGADTVLMGILRAVEGGRLSRAPVQRLVDRVAAVFVPLVIVIAAITFAVWALAGGDNWWIYAVLNSVTVLVVACPCALGLATPMSLTVGLGVGGRRGVLFRSAEALQALGQADEMVLDKTGTLTRGEPRVSALRPATGFSEERLLASAAAAEARSDHPLARAVAGAAAERGMEVDATAAHNFRNHPGQGVDAELDGVRVLVGSRRLLEGAGIAPVDEPAHTAATVVHVAIGGAAAGVMLVEDELKPNAREAVDELTAMGLRLGLLSGDAEGAVGAVAAQLGITRHHGAMDPLDKAEHVAARRRAGARIVMVGDGINDAPALANASAGVAMGDGSDIAIEGGDVVVVGGELAGVVRSVRLARAVLANIKVSLAFAFGYNLLLIPLAAGVAYPLLGAGEGGLLEDLLALAPVLAALAMSLSSFSVILNALRLRRARL